MGKIRVKTIGIEEDEKDQKKKAKLKAETKRIEAAKKQGAEKKAQEESEANEEPKEKSSPVIASETKQSLEKSEIAASPTKPRSDEEKTDEKPAEKKSAKKESKYKSKKSKKAKPHSASYLATAKLVDKTKTYSLSEAIEILQKAKKTKLDETVELHINTNEKGVSGNLLLPHGTGKKSKIEIADYASDPKHVEELVKTITAGQVNFDILIATPETMSHLAKVARVLGPKGLMPNPKNGTISPKPKEAIKKFEGGQINFKTEPKFPIIHMSVGKISFEEKQLSENIKAIFKAVQTKNIKNVTLKSTMSPGIKLSI